MFFILGYVGDVPTPPLFGWLLSQSTGGGGGNASNSRASNSSASAPLPPPGPHAAQPTSEHWRLILAGFTTLMAACAAVLWVAGKVADGAPDYRKVDLAAGSSPPPSMETESSTYGRHRISMTAEEDADSPTARLLGSSSGHV